ncbi:MAG TPA: hypothetical protein VGY58_07845, partial [Gemmataceae bacterium]|nr:hypothetical protein [Gemmataceae bacterium]
ALTIFLRACARGAPGLAVAAGMVAGVAAQTKYTALLTPAVMVLYALLFHRLRLGTIAALVACFVFAAWETLMMHRYGHSHFLYHLSGHTGLLKQHTSSLLSLIMIVGGVAPAIMLLGMAAFRVRPALVALASGGVLLGFAVLPHIDQDVPARLGMPFHANRDSLVFGFLGCLAWGTLILCGRRLCSYTPMTPRRDLNARFLILWLGLEVAGYFVLSPFPAVRRVLDIMVVSTLLVGRLLARECPAATWRVRSIVTAGIALGVGYYVVDLQDALAQESVAEQCAAWVGRQQIGKGWYVGHWGFQFYAERAGLAPVVPGITRLRCDDWLVVPSARIAQQKIDISADAFRPSATFRVDDWPPFSTTSCYYGSRSPLEPLQPPRLSVTVYRVLRDVTPDKRAGKQ